MDEVSFNFYHERHDNIAQLMDIETINGERNTSDIVAIPLADELRRNYASDFKHVAVVFPNFTHTVAIGDKRISQSGQWVQADFPEMLSLKMLEGKQNALKDPNAVLLSKSLSDALFGNLDAINKSIRLDNMTEVIVGGVYEDLPLSSTFHETKLFLSWDKALTVMSWLKEAQTQWDNRVQRIYVQLNDHIDMATANNNIKNLIAPHVKNRKEELMLYPMNKWHLYSDFKDGKISGGRISYVWMFAAIGIFVLFLACINFMNLSTARSQKRSKEVGIRKTLGSLRGQLIWQFLGESLLVVMLALVIALALVQLTIPFFNAITNKELFIPFTSIPFLASITIFGIVTGFVSGSYPALYLSAFDPIKVLKGTSCQGRYASIPRKVLIVVQFTVSITLMIGTIIVYRQIQFAKNRPVGYSRDGLIMVTMNTPESYGAPYNALRNELLETGVVDNMAKSSTPATEAPENNTDMTWNGKDPGTVPQWGEVVVTPDYGKTVGWKIKDGRDFPRTFATDSGALIINEMAAKVTRLKNPVGETISWGGKNHMIVGVVKDLVMESPFQQVKPAIFRMGYSDDFYNALSLRIKSTASVHDALSKIERVFKKYNPNGSFEYKFIDEEYARKFSDEERIGNLAACFTILAIFISCLGLFGLASFVAEQRTKEIGIRKVLGASVFNLWKLLSGEFVILVLISFIISFPFAYYLMYSWLQHYQYRTELIWWLFSLPLAGTLLITLITVSIKAIKAAVANPVNSLKGD